MSESISHLVVPVTLQRIGEVQALAREINKGKAPPEVTVRVFDSKEVGLELIVTSKSEEAIAAVLALPTK